MTRRFGLRGSLGLLAAATAFGVLPASAGAASIGPTPFGEQGALYDVSCPATTQCTAAGGPGVVTFNPFAPQGAVATPMRAAPHRTAGGSEAPSRPGPAEFVSCPTATQCTALTVRSLGQDRPCTGPNPSTCSPPVDPWPPEPEGTPANDNSRYVNATSYGIVTFNPQAPGDPTPFPLETGQVAIAFECPATNQCTVLAAANNAPRWEAITFDPAAPGVTSKVNLPGAKNQVGMTGPPTGFACPTVGQCSSVAPTCTQSSSGTAQCKVSVTTFDPRVPGSPPSATLDGNLAALACASATQCTAMGGSNDLPGVKSVLVTFNPQAPGAQVVVNAYQDTPRFITCAASEQCTWLSGVSSDGGLSGGTVDPRVAADYERTPIAPPGTWTNAAEDVTAFACPTKEQCTAVGGDRYWRGRAVIFTFDPRVEMRRANFEEPGDGDGGGTEDPTPPAAEVRQALTGSLALPASQAKVAKILKQGGYRATFVAPAPGKQKITWRAKVATKKSAGRAAAKQVTIASGAKRFKKAGSGKVRVKLTKKGRKLLKGAKRVKLVAVGTFTPVGGKPITTKRKVTLK